jgi:hypothetical protein
MTDQPSPIDAIVSLMRDNWNLPPDCNDGEIYAYAEHVGDRIQAGEDAASLYAYARAIQTEKLDMPDSQAYRRIVEGAVALFKSIAGSAGLRRARND